MLGLRHRTHEASNLIPLAEMTMGCTAHVFLRPKRGAPLEDLGAIFVDPDPKRSEICPLSL
jgi:hypothetical protein